MILWGVGKYHHENFRIPHVSSTGFFKISEGSLKILTGEKAICTILRLPTAVLKVCMLLGKASASK